MSYKIGEQKCYKNESQTVYGCVDANASVGKILIKKITSLLFPLYSKFKRKRYFEDTSISRTSFDRTS